MRARSSVHVEITMAGDSSMHPAVEWAQRRDKLYLTINVEDCKNPEITIEDGSLYFKGVGGPEKKTYEVKIEFYKEINKEESKYVHQSRTIPFILKKKEEGPYWPRLLKEGKKVHWLKTDFDKWRDEDDSDFEDDKDMRFEEMMSQMGNFNAADTDNLDDEEADSDDENLPDLE